jgi:hypothetical protein
MEPTQKSYNHLKILISTYICNKSRVFSSSEQVGSILLATSMRDQHFTFILNSVFGRNVPIPSSSSLRVVNTLATVGGGTLMSYKRLASFSSASDRSLSERVFVATSSLG